MLLRGRAEVARQAHNLEAVGSIPTPATNDFSRLSVTDGLFLPHFREDERLLFKVNWKCIFLPSGPVPDGSQLMDRLTIN